MLTFLDIFHVDPDELVSVGSAMFVRHTQCMQQLVDDNTLSMATLSKRHSLVAARSPSNRGASIP